MFDFKLWKPNSKIYQGLNLAKFSSLKIDIIKWGYTGFPGTLPNNRPFKRLIVHACMIPQALCTGVTISQTPRKVVSKAPGGKYFSAAEWGKGTALTWNNPASTRGWVLCPPCSFHPSPKGEFLPGGRRKVAARFLQWNGCRELWGTPLTLSSFPSACAQSSPGSSAFGKVRDAPAASLRKTCRSQLLNYSKHPSLTGTG